MNHSHARRPVPLLLAGCMSLLLAATAIGQTGGQISVPTPLWSSTSTDLRGFWFRVPSSAAPFAITGLRVPAPSAYHNQQLVEVRRYATFPPSGSGTALFGRGQVTYSIIPCHVVVQPGDVICIWGLAQGWQSLFGYVYGCPLAPGPYSSSALGTTLTLAGCSASTLLGMPLVNPTFRSDPYLGCIEVYVQPVSQATVTYYGAGCMGLAHGATSRPVIGTSVTLLTQSLPPSVATGATILGLVQHDPGIDLTTYGLTGCFQYTSADTVYLWTPLYGLVGSTTFPIPNAPGFAGLEVFSQGAVLSPGINPASALTSNGIALHLDLY